MTSDNFAKGRETPLRIELLGASVGERWQLEEFPQRVKDVSFQIFAHQEYGFDKSRLLREMLARSERPSAVIIKECAAYFPGDLSEYKHQVMDWTAKLKHAGIRPILATTVPVTENLPTWLYLKRAATASCLRQS